MRNILLDEKTILFLEFLLFLLMLLMFLLTTEAGFLYLEPGFGERGKSFSAPSSPTASNALQQKMLVWVSVGKCWTAQKLSAEIQKKKYRKGMEHFFLIKKVMQKLNNTEKNFVFSTAKGKFFQFPLATKG